MKTIISTIIVVLLSCTSFVYAQQNTPSNFPKYQDTGNKKADNTAYDQAKKAWVEANPEAYQQMGGQLEAKPTSDTRNIKKKDGVAAMIPDNADYDQAKKEWIKANQEAYRKMGGQIEAKPKVKEHSIETEAENCEKTEDVAVIIPNNCITWEITDAIIIDENNQLKTSELKILNPEIQEEFLAHKIQWKISPEGMLYIFYHTKYSNHYKFEKANHQLTLSPTTKTECDDEIKVFFIEKWTDTQIIVNMPDEDEDSTLMYQLTLTPIF